jgi:HEAT repeat protein
MARVFISYVKDNFIEVQKLVEILKIYDIDVWLDRDRIRPGDRWENVVRRGISEGDFFIACFSSEYLSRSRTYMNVELTLAIEELRLRPTDRAWFIPVLLSNCDIPDRDIGGGSTLRSIHWVNLFENWDNGIQSILSVIQPESPKLFELIRQLKDVSARARIKASDDLGKLGMLAEKAVPYLLEALNDENETVCASAANALGDIGVIDEKVIAALLLKLESYRGYPRDHVIKALARFGEKGIISKLIDIVADRSEYYPQAGRALSLIGSADNNIHIEIIKGLIHQDNLVRSCCANAILAPYCDASHLMRFVPDLINLLEKSNPKESEFETIVQLLAKCSKEANFDASQLMRFVPDLINLLEKSNPKGSKFKATVHLLSKIGKPPNEAVPVLIQKLKSLDDLDWENRCAVVLALGEIGDPAAIPTLTRLFHDRWHGVSRCAIDAVKKMEQ